MSRPRQLGEDVAVLSNVLLLWRGSTQLGDLGAEGFDTGGHIRHPRIDLRPPLLEVILRRAKVVDGDLDLVDPAITFIDPLGLVIKLAEDECELVFNLHCDLEASAVVMSQDVDADPSSLGLDL
jgi:hypothetical protein